jgi:hypothetical protein
MEGRQYDIHDTSPIFPILKDSRSDSSRQYRWVVKIGGHVVGEAELLHDSEESARLRRLRIDPAWQHTAALKHLICSVEQFCNDHGSLCLRLDPGCAPRWVMNLLRRRGSFLSPTRSPDPDPMVRRRPPGRDRLVEAFAGPNRGQA